MKHLTEGELRAALDHELERDPLRHLETCAACQARRQTLQAELARIANKLTFLAADDEAVPPAQTVWSRFPYQTKQQKETSMFKKFFAFPVARFAAVAILALAALMAFPSTRALAGELLNLFRVQQVTVLPIDMSGMEKMTGNEALGNKMSELMSSSTEVIKEPDEPANFDNAEAAGKAAGFEARFPQGMTAANITVMDSSAFALTIDRARTQVLLNEAGRGDIVLPEAIDGAEITVNLSAAISATFGDCPDVNEESPHRTRELENCLVFGQMPSPVVQAPTDVDMAQLAQLALEFTGMSKEEAAALASTVDWTSTLVVPLPRDAADYSDVSVDGVTGSLIQNTSEYAPQYALIWVKDGMVYFISGSSADPARAFDLVNALP